MALVLLTETQDTISGLLLLHGLHEVSSDPTLNCPCINGNSETEAQPPLFVGHDYFCDTGSLGQFDLTTFYGADPLWDVARCGPLSTCCSSNNHIYLLTKVDIITA